MLSVTHTLWAQGEHIMSHCKYNIVSLTGADFNIERKRHLFHNNISSALLGDLQCLTRSATWRVCAIGDDLCRQRRHHLSHIMGAKRPWLYSLLYSQKWHLHLEHGKGQGHQANS